MTGHRALLVALLLGTPVVAIGWQPDSAMLRRVFEEALTKRREEYGAMDPRTAQAARDLGLFAQREGDRVTARRGLSEAVRIDETALGVAAPQTLEDVAALAAVSSPAVAEPLLRRAAESPDPTVAGPALSTLAELRRAAGDRTGAAVLLRRALGKAEAIDGKEGPTTGLVLRSLAPLVDPPERVGLLERVLAIDRQALGAGHPQTLADVRGLAGLLRRLGRLKEAADLEARYGAR